MPRPLLERPDIPEHLVFVWSAFWALSSDRPPILGSIGQVPFSSIDRYAARFGLVCRDEFERFERLIRAMDAAFREKVLDDAKKEP